MAAGYAAATPLPSGFTRAALELEWYLRLGDPDRRAIAPYFVFGFDLPRFIESMYLKFGYAVATESANEDGYTWGIGVATRARQFSFLYAGASLRIGYQQFRLENTLDALQLQLVFQ